MPREYFYFIPFIFEKNTHFFGVIRQNIHRLFRTRLDKERKGLYNLCIFMQDDAARTRNFAVWKIRKEI